MLAIAEAPTAEELDAEVAQAAEELGMVEDAPETPDDAEGDDASSEDASSGDDA